MAKLKITVKDIEENANLVKAGFKVGDDYPSKKDLDKLIADTDGDGVTDGAEKRASEPSESESDAPIPQDDKSQPEQPKKEDTATPPAAPVTPTTTFTTPKEDLSMRATIKAEDLDAKSLKSQNTLTVQKKQIEEAEKLSENIPKFEKQELKYVGTNFSFSHKGVKYMKGDSANPKNKTELESLMKTKKFILA